jgi:electron transfer flavoprotein alpha subunit
VVGRRFINERRAMDLDANCRWARGKADVLYVADAFQVMVRVTALLGTQAADNQEIEAALT